MSDKTIICSTHGEQKMTQVCDHTLMSIRDRRPRGLLLWRDSNGIICGWCNECAERAKKSEKDPDRTPLKFDVKTVCVSCLAPVQTLNGGGVWYR